MEKHLLNITIKNVTNNLLNSAFDDEYDDVDFCQLIDISIDVERFLFKEKIKENPTFLLLNKELYLYQLVENIENMEEFKKIYTEDIINVYENKLKNLNLNIYDLSKDFFEFLDFYILKIKDLITEFDSIPWSKPKPFEEILKNKKEYVEK